MEPCKKTSQNHQAKGMISNFKINQTKSFQIQEGNSLYRRYCPFFRFSSFDYQLWTRLSPVMTCLFRYLPSEFLARLFDEAWWKPGFQSCRCFSSWGQLVGSICVFAFVGQVLSSFSWYLFCCLFRYLSSSIGEGWSPRVLCTFSVLARHRQWTCVRVWLCWTPIVHKA